MGDGTSSGTDVVGSSVEDAAVDDLCVCEGGLVCARGGLCVRERASVCEGTVLVNNRPVRVRSCRREKVDRRGIHRFPRGCGGPVLCARGLMCVRELCLGKFRVSEEFLWI